MTDLIDFDLIFVFIRFVWLVMSYIVFTVVLFSRHVGELARGFLS